MQIATKMAAESEISLSEELHRYRQRDLIPTHLYRLGTKLFGSEPTRRRVIDAARYVPRELVPHAVNLRRTWDGRPLQIAQQKPSTLQRRHSDLNLDSVKARDFTEDKYRQWMDQRKRTRDGLDSMALSERWLCSKTRTPLENKLLAELRGKRRAAIAASSQIPASKSEEIMPSRSNASTRSISHQKSQARRRRSTLIEAETLSSHILHGRQRFVSLLTLHDPTGTGRISIEELESVLLKMCPSVSQDSLEMILKGLQASEDGTVDYRPLLKGGLLHCVEKYFESERSLLATAIDSTDSAEKVVPTETVKTLCTMSGKRGELATAYKDEERRQFEVLLEFCQERGIILDRQLLEKALLLPYDHPRESCLAALRQPGLDLLSQQFTAPPREKAKTVEKEDYGKKFGWAYKEMKGKGKPSVIRLPKPPKQNTSEKTSTSSSVRKATLRRVTVAPKVDCWLTFKEYQWHAREVTSRPGFNYKYHGLPDNNAFWPGALVDKLRLWLPMERLEDKPYSLYNIFQPVTHPRIYNPHRPNMEQRRAWPENERGYVQFGGDSRKTYGLS